MKRWMLKLLLVLLLGAALVLGGKLLFRVFVTDRVTDRGGMENPYAVEAAEESAAPAHQEPENTK